MLVYLNCGPFFIQNIVY